MSIKLKRIAKKATSILLVSILSSTTIVEVSAIEGTQSEHSFENNSLILHSSEEDIILNEDKVNIDGNVFSRKDVEYTGLDENFKVTGNVLKGDKGDVCEAINYIDLINGSADYDFTLTEYTSYTGSLNLNESSIYAEKSIDFDEAVFNGSGNITAKGDISMNIVSDKAEEQTAIIMSENGDITLNSSQLTFNGLIYAPNGKVEINSKNIDFSGAVYAKQIEINGTSLTMKYNDFLPNKLVCDAGEDVITYIEDGAKLSASCNYDNADITFSVSELCSEFVKITDENTLTPSFEFTQEGEYEVTMTAQLNATKVTDKVKIIVKPEPVVTYTSSEDFAGGNSLSGENDELKLDYQSKEESNGISTEYNTSNEDGRGISVLVNQSKATVKSTEDTISLDYTLGGYGKADNEVGNDMILLVDNSGSMSSKLNILKQSALNILEYMGPNDRFGVADLGRVKQELTNDKETLTKAVNYCAGGSGSSDTLNGVKIALPMFDELSEDRDKYIILLADGECPINSIDAVAKSAYDKNVRIIAFQMNTERVYQNSYCGYGMQELAAVTKGYYMLSTDTNEISNAMNKFADEVYNSAGNDAKLSVTITDKNYLDTANMTTPPTSTVENADGSVTLEWKYDSIDIDKAEEIKLPLKTKLLTGTGYKVIAKNASLTYYNRNGKATYVGLEDVIVGRNDYADNGSWQSKTYDSGKDGCTWSLVSWNANYEGTSKIDVYLSVSDDGKSFSEPVKVMNNQELTGLKGRYIKAMIDMKKSEDGASPVLYDLTIHSLDKKSPDTELLGSHLNIDCNSIAFTNVPFTAILNINSDNANVKEIKWSVTDAENVKINGSKELFKYITFAKAGEYNLTAEVITEDNFTAKASVNINVTDIKLVDKENNENTIPDLKMTVTGIPTEVLKNNSTFEFNVSFNDPSIVAWARVSYNCTDKNAHNRRALKIDEAGNVKVDVGDFSNATLVIEAFDEYGNSVKETRVIPIDGEKPTIKISTSPSSAYVGSNLTITATATDNYGIESTVFTIDDKEVQLDENGQYVFTDTVAGTHTAKMVATDLAGHVSEKSCKFTVYDDTQKPDCRLYVSNMTLGNSQELLSSIYDNQSGLKFYEMTINGKPVELTKAENNYYTYLFTPTETGEYEIVVNAEDNAGNKNSVTKVIKCTPDTGKPSVSVKLSNAEVIVGNDIKVTVTASDNVKVTELHFYQDGVEKTLLEDNTFIYTADDSNLNDSGYKYVEFKAIAKDNAGNESYPSVQKLKVINEDTQKPNASLSATKQIDINSTAYVSVSASDNIAVADIKLYVNDKLVELDQNNRYQLDTTAFCTYDLKLVVTDTSGNETIKTQTSEVKDISKPKISIKKDKSKYVIGDDALFTATVTDNHKVEAVTAKFNGTAVELVATGSGEYTYTAKALTAGTHKFEVTAKDASGNEYTTYITFTVADTEKPVVTIASDREIYAVNEQPTITYVIQDNVEIAKVEAFINDNAIEYINGSLVLPEVYEPGEYTIKIKATDTAGNTTEASCSFEVMKTLDITCPEIKNIYGYPTYWQVGEGAYIEVTATDDSGKVYTTVSVDSKEFTFNPKNNRYEYTPDKEGYIDIVIHAEDESGNYSEITVRLYVYKNLKEHKLVVTAPEVITVGEKATITLSSSDNYPFTETSVLCETTNQKLVGENNVYTFSSNVEKEYKFVATGTDGQAITDTVKFTINVSSGYQAEVNSPTMQKYLQKTNETALTNEMLETIKSFKSPVDAYSYVVNTVRYESYINSRRGSVGAYETRNANDVDQASLLIAFLREMGYPARYVSGNVSLTKEQVLSLFAAEDFDSAWQMLADSYRNVVMNPSLGVLKMDEVWVETYVPYSMLGVTDEATKDLGVWVALDPAIKASELSVLEVEPDEELDESVQKYQEVFAKYENEDFGDLVDELKEIKKSDTVSERFIIEQKFDVLPSKLQYTVNSEKSRFANISTDMSDTISISISDYYGDRVDLGTYKVSDIYNKRVSIQYVGDTGSATIFEMNASQIANNIFKPALTIDGEIVAYGPATTLGNEQSLSVSLKSNNQTESFNDVILAGSMYSIVLDTGAISEQTVNKFLNDAATENPIEGEKKATKTSYYSEAQVGTFLAYAGSEYFRWYDGYNYLSAAQHNVETATKTKCAVLGYDVDTRENFYGAYTGMLPGYFFIDVNINTVYGASRTGDVDAKNSHMFASTAMGSYFEGFLWEYFLGHNGISTIHIFAYASDAGAQFLPIYKHNYGEQISKLSFLSNDEISDIRNAVNSGYCVLIPDQKITMNSWSGTGYIIADLNNYEKFVFKISGGLNGGASSEEDALDKVINNGVTYEVFDALGVDCDEFYQNAFSLAQVVYSALLIKTVAEESNMTINYTTDLLKYGCKKAFDLDDERLDNVYTRFSDVFSHYTDMLDSILSYGRETIDGVREITSTLLHMFCELTGIEADDVAEYVAAFLGVDPSKYEEEEKSFADKAKDRAKGFLTNLICGIFGWE
ncbi:MAG: Ig-like domain-containing protein [Acutalibacteraceae bacterium]|nr:Ig-like domain-containing protein [Acutalibacteraceae bacterium]